MTKLLWIAFAIGLAACSHDHDLEDYKQELFQQDYAKVAAIQGRYSGSLTSISTGKVLSAMQMTLRASAKSVSSSDSTNPSVQPKVTAEITFAGPQNSTKVPVDGGTYSDQSHLYHAELTIPGDAQTQIPSIQLDITGTIGEDGSFNGTISSGGYEDEGGSFSLTKDGSSLQDLVKTLDLGPNSLFAGSTVGSSHTFQGSFTDTKGALPAVMTIAAPLRTRLQQVADLLVPSQEHFVTVNIAINGLNNIYFSSAEIDTSEQKLYATQTVSLQGGTVSATLNLSCDQFRVADPKYHFSCTYYSNLLGQVAQLRFNAP